MKFKSCITSSIVVLSAVGLPGAPGRPAHPDEEIRFRSWVRTSGPRGHYGGKQALTQKNVGARVPTIVRCGSEEEGGAMRLKFWMLKSISIVLFAALVLPPQLFAQHHRYKLIDVGTFGGSWSVIAPTDFGGPENPGRGLTSNGVIVGAAETTRPDPFSPGCDGCFAPHAFRWKDGVLTDLGTLRGVNSGLTSIAHWINDRGWIAGFSYTGAVDPLTGDPAGHPVLWRKDNIIDLGTLGGEFAAATAINNRGQVVGFSTNGKPDPFGTSQVRAFLWQSGLIRDLGTLCEADGVCGVDAQAFAVNESGQVAGISSTNITANATTGVPTVRPFLWERGRMIDLGTLGGTLSAVDGPAILLNDRGQVAGTSTLAGDQTYHPFVWEHGVMIDVGTLGGDTGFITWINDAGEAIGSADLPGPSGSQSHHGFLWRNGVKIDLGTLGGTSHAEGINSQGQVVGRSKPTPDAPVQHAFLWENGGPMVDLNTLIPLNSPLLLEEGGLINDRGEIAGRGVPPGCDDVDACGHAFLLIPCENAASCENKVDVGAAIQLQTALVRKRASAITEPSRTAMQLLSTWRAKLGQTHPRLAHKEW
jgi:probable HAF family extracellular repeat protein